MKGERETAFLGRIDDDYPYLVMQRPTIYLTARHRQFANERLFTNAAARSGRG